jgi:DUF1680 family protein
VFLNKEVSFATDFIEIENRKLLAIHASIRLGNSWDKTLYRPLSQKSIKDFSVKLIPYFAWGNHKKGEMTVWMPY